MERCVGFSSIDLVGHVRAASVGGQLPISPCFVQYYVICRSTGCRDAGTSTG
jgi:hypothetical protein